jgi:hypothetical protein
MVSASEGGHNTGICELPEVDCVAADGESPLLYRKFNGTITAVAITTNSRHNAKIHKIHAKVHDHSEDCQLPDAYRGGQASDAEFANHAIDSGVITRNSSALFYALVHYD